MDTWTIVVISIVIGLVAGYVYVYVLRDWLDYRKARKEIFAFVNSYKRRCTGNNRFIVTVESLQDSFREYSSNVIAKVWIELVNERIIETDPQDNVWCVR